MTIGTTPSEDFILRLKVNPPKPNNDPRNLAEISGELNALGAEGLNVPFSFSGVLIRSEFLGRFDFTDIKLKDNQCSEILTDSNQGAQQVTVGISAVVQETLSRVPEAKLFQIAVFEGGACIEDKGNLREFLARHNHQRKS